MLRIDDLSQMRQMQKELTKMRKAKDKKKASSKNKAAHSDRPMSGMPSQQQTSGLGQIATTGGSVAISNINQLTAGVLNSNNNPTANQLRNRI